MKTRGLIETLETRIAPATLLNPTTLSFIDADGDLVTIRISRGTFQLTDADGGELNDNFIFTASGLGQRLELIIIAFDPSFAKTNLTVTAQRFEDQGDGSVNIGAIDATGIDVGKVRVPGDLASLTAGDVVTSTPGLVALHVRSLGGFEDGEVAIRGRLGVLEVGGNMHSSLRVLGGADGSLGTAKIGGSLLGSSLRGNLETEGNIGSLAIGGDVRGSGTLFGTGKIRCDGDIGSIKIGGALSGALQEKSGSITAKSIGALSIGGDVQGGAGDYSGFIAAQKIGTIKVGGAIHGSIGIQSGAIQSSFTGTATIGGSVTGGVASFSGNVALGLLGSLRIGGDVVGGSGDQVSGFISAHAAKSITIGGSLLARSFNGVTANGSLSVGNVGTLTIGGSIEGGDAERSGSIYSFGKIGILKLGGSLHGGAGENAGSIRALAIGSLKIGGSVEGRNGAPAIITAEKSIGSLTIGGGVHFARILAGYDAIGSTDNGEGGVNADATIGNLIVGGDWTASSLAAGVEEGADGFGTATQKKIDSAILTDLAGVISRIGSIVVRGQVFGTPGAGDAYGFGAEQIGSVTVGSTRLLLLPGANNDVFGAKLGTTNDFAIRES